MIIIVKLTFHKLFFLWTDVVEMILWLKTDKKMYSLNAMYKSVC